MRAKVRKLKVDVDARKKHLRLLESRVFGIECFLEYLLYKLIVAEDLQRIEPTKTFRVEYTTKEGHMVSIGRVFIEQDAFYSYNLIPLATPPPIVTREVWEKLLKVTSKQYNTKAREKHALEYFFSLQSRTSVFAKDLHRRIWRGSEVKIL